MFANLTGIFWADITVVIMVHIKDKPNLADT